MPTQFEDFNYNNASSGAGLYPMQNNFTQIPAAGPIDMSQTNGVMSSFDDYFNKNFDVTSGVYDPLKTGDLLDPNNTDWMGGLDIGLKGLGALGGLYSMFDQAKTNRLNRSLVKRNDARQANEIARRDKQRKSLGSSFSKAGKNIRSSFDNQG